MTPDLRKTLVFVAVAVLLTGAAFVRMPDRNRGALEEYKDQGQPFFPAFTDPLACTDLEVVEFDNSLATARQFKVMSKDGKWVIPSHNNYPADAKDRLAKTAGGVMDLKKDTIRSDRVEDHEALGVLDPLDQKAPLKGRGKKVTLRDKSEKVLAEFIIGNEVKDRPSMRYVRVPSSKRTYGVNVKAELSTKFADWIETNLLKLDAGHVRSVTFDNHKVDPEQRRIVPGEKVNLFRADGVAPWMVDFVIPPGQELNHEKITALTTALADLKIVGVRPKPDSLSKDLKVAATNDVKPTTTAELQSLVQKGFYPTRDGLFSNQGQVIVKTDEGAVYTLRFGEVVFGTGDAVESGKDEGKAATKKADNATTENRYLMVTIAFDPTLVPEPEKPQEALVIPDDPFQKAPNDPKRIAEEKAIKEKADREHAERAKRLADAEKKVQTLTDRFAGWYYVTPGDSFRAIALDKTALAKPKSETPPGPGGSPGGAFPGGSFPGGSFPGPGGLPPSFPGGHP
jgi:Domain of unknown function (DUF4340)